MLLSEILRQRNELIDKIHSSKKEASRLEQELKAMDNTYFQKSEVKLSNKKYPHAVVEGEGRPLDKGYGY